MSAAFLDDDDVLTGLITVGRPDDLEAARELVLERARVKPDAIATRGVPLRECLLERAAVTPMTASPSSAWRPAAAGLARGHGAAAGHRAARQSRGRRATARDARHRCARAGSSRASRSGRDLWKPLVVRDRARRRYRLMFEDDALDIWVLSWMPGQATGYHDHGSSNVALTALQGCVLERQTPRRAGRASSASCGRASSQPGPAGYIHSVAHRAGAPAVTLHAYSPPLVQVGQYRAGPEGELLREQQHGRQELLDHTIGDAA